MNKRLKTFIEKECRYRFQRIYHIVDSQIVHAMIQKNSYGLNTFAATRMGEIQEGTSQTDWYWVESEHNIADCLTRGKKPSDIGLESIWQKGPEFLKQPEEEWPITRNYLEPQLPERVKTAMATNIVAANKELSNITKNWDWNNLKGFGVTEGFEWIFTSADAPWQNGVTEALIRSVKRVINASIGDSILTFSELQRVLYEVANLLNERPIGRHPTSPDDGAYLCPNDLLLGRATSRVPSCLFGEKASNRPTVHICSNNNLYLLEEVDERLFPKFANKTEMAYFS